MSKINSAYLSDQHRRELNLDSSIDLEVITERGYSTLTRPTNGSQPSRDKLRRLGFPSWAIKEDRYFPGLLIPIYGPTGQRASYQWKPHTAVPNRDGKHMKYASPKGQKNRLDVHPRNRNAIVDPTVPLWITEGVKKADALTSKGLCVVALTGVFNWRSTLGTLGDWEDVPLKGREVGIIFDADARSNPNVCRAMIRLGRWLKSKQAKTIKYLIVPDHVGDGDAAIKVKGADDYLAASGRIDDLLAVATTEEPTLPGSGDTFTDARLADTVADDVLAGSWRWCAALGWLGWDGRRWAPRPEVEAADEIRRYLLNRYAEAADQVRQGSGNPATVTNWQRTLSASRIAAVLRLARGIEGVLTDAEDLDAHPDLLNVANGVVGLVTGQLGPHDPDLLLTKITDVLYRPDATHADWVKALGALPEDVRGWYQVRCGQAITGYPPETDTMIIQQGGGNNGKTTVVVGLKNTLGDYYAAVSQRALLGDPSQHPTELTAFRGARLTVVEELPEEGRLNSARLKALVGTEVMKARKIRQDEVEWDASHTLIVNTNPRPRVDETDDGTWRRYLLLRFPYTYVPPDRPITGDHQRPGDPLLRARIKAGAEGQHEAILAWLVRGAAAWYANGRTEPVVPDRVSRDTRTWRAENDQVVGLFDDLLVPEAGQLIAGSDLLWVINDWLRQKGHREWSDKLLTARFAEHDLVRRHNINRVRVRADKVTSRPSPGLQTRLAQQPWAWSGVRFRTDADPDHGGETGSRSGDESDDESGRGDRPENRVVQLVQAAFGSPYAKEQSSGTQSSLHKLHKPENHAQPDEFPRPVAYSDPAPHKVQDTEDQGGGFPPPAAYPGALPFRREP